MVAPPGIDEIRANLETLEDWEDRYRYLIELGQSLAPLSADEHNAANKVDGCMSQVWLVTERDRIGGDALLRYRGDSDALIVKGLVAVLIALYSGRTARDVAATDAIAIFDKMGLREHLSTQRSNGLVAMVKRIRSDAARVAV